MRALESFNSQLIRHRRPVVLDAAYVGRLISLSSAAVHGASRLARLLRQEAARARVLPSDEMPADVVNFSSEVTYRDEATGRSHTVTLVLPPDADVRAGRISVLTPVGTALIGQAQGATVDCEFPVGTMRRLTVLRVDQSPPDQPAGRAADATHAARGATA
jgi:regulator of nucleoside diphosphate kinase